MNQIVRQAKKILTRRREVLARAWKHSSEGEQDYVDQVEKDWTDAASDHEAAEVLHSLSDRERRELQEIDDALARIADGSYGLCQQCGRAIGRQRLIAIPEARHCLGCTGSRL